MTALLLALKDGMTIDDALIQMYGFDIDGLEDAWRQAIGAQPRPVSTQPTAQPTPTFVPTYVPVSGAPLAQQSTPTVIPTSSLPKPAPEIRRTAPPLGYLSSERMLRFLFVTYGVLAHWLIVVSRNHKGRE
jgi:hypothetical protein